MGRQQGAPVEAVGPAGLLDQAHALLGRAALLEPEEGAQQGEKRSGRGSEQAAGDLLVPAREQVALAQLDETVLDLAFQLLGQAGGGGLDLLEDVLAADQGAVFGDVPELHGKGLAVGLQLGQGEEEGLKAGELLP
jgi:hypothetical protein